MSEITGGAPYGTGALAGGDGSRQPSLFKERKFHNLYRNAIDSER